MKQEWPPETVSSATVASPALAAEITTTECRHCRAQVSGVNGRYACGLCGWVNHWAEGSTVLPAAEVDPDFPGR